MHSHWKLIAILLAIVLALITAEIDSAPAAPPLSARLRAHVEAAAATKHDTSGRYIESSLKAFGYAPARLTQETGGRRLRSIEAVLRNVAPGARPERVFLVGDRGSGTAAVLELARLLKTVQPSRGTEIRFVFLLDQAAAAPDGAAEDAGNFIAFAGTMASSARVRQALAAFKEQPDTLEHGLAAPAHVMGVTLSSHGKPYTPSLGAYPALLVTDTGFLGYPYHETTADADKVDVEAMARTVSGLARTLTALAGAVRT
ncbi:hypothetical protein [Massilia sp. ST3]|uniref:hypothetical protein n=1 Tax=Massilia sp. ST3 TaxID=2824903 RepID=UPI001B845E52|nr:hypothetical protein [Massilia sp. ST3]MBQ5946388.1 hypothetical protein [Massilia sp. ST3]